MKANDFEELVIKLTEWFLDSTVDKDSDPDPTKFSHYHGMYVMIVSAWLTYHSSYGGEWDEIDSTGTPVMLYEEEDCDWEVPLIRDKFPEMWRLFRELLSQDKFTYLSALAWANHQTHVRDTNFIEHWGSNIGLSWETVDFISQNGIGEAFPEMFEDE